MCCVVGYAVAVVAVVAVVAAVAADEEDEEDDDRFGEASISGLTAKAVEHAYRNGAT